MLKIQIMAWHFELILEKLNEEITLAIDGKGWTGRKGKMVGCLKSNVRWDGRKD